MRAVKFGDGPATSPLGLSCLALSGERYGALDDGIATIHAAVDAGVTLLDTGDFYDAGGRNEMLVREALWSVRREKLLLAVSFGVQHAPDGTLLGMDARPASVKNFLTYSLRRLDTDYVDLYSPAYTDPTVPIEDTVGAIADLVQAGYVRHIGLPNVSDHTVRRAHAVHPIAAVRAEYSLLNRSAEARLLPTLRQLGIALLASDGGLFATLGGDVEPDARRERPGPGGSGGEGELSVVTRLEELARERDLTPIRLALAWMLAREDAMVPLLAPRSPDELADALGALTVRLSDDDIARLVPARIVDTTRHLAALQPEFPGRALHAVR